VHGGHVYFSEMERMILAAAETIHLQTYIYEEDLTGNRIAELLMAASRRGVEVYLLADGYASRGLSDAFLGRLKDTGIRFRYFAHVFSSGNRYFGRRLHHKILVTDGREALVGGLNISDRYNDLPGQPAWLDWAILTEGEAAYEIHRICTGVWFRFHDAARKVLSARPAPAFDPAWNCPVRVRRNDWINRKNQVSQSYMEMCRMAESEIIIMSSYFLPGRVIRRGLRQAVRRGVRIRLILAGKSDVEISKHAERYMYRWLFSNGIEIHEYTRNVLHGKVAVKDGRWVTGGSYNVNNVSAYASVEMNLDVDDPDFGLSVRDTLNGIIERDCVQVTESGYSMKYGVLQRFWQFICYETLRVVFFLFTFYFRQR
jgi:cardiolipin synthase